MDKLVDDFINMAVRFSQPLMEEVLERWFSHYRHWLSPLVI